MRTYEDTFSGQKIYPGKVCNMRHESRVLDANKRVSATSVMCEEDGASCWMGYALRTCICEQ